MTREWVREVRAMPWWKWVGIGWAFFTIVLPATVYAVRLLRT